MAERTRVELAGDRLVIRGPRGWRQWTPRGGRESIDVRISLPTGSDRADQSAELSPQIGAALEQLGKRVHADKAANGAGIDLTCGQSR